VEGMLSKDMATVGEYLQTCNCSGEATHWLLWLKPGAARSKGGKILSPVVSMGGGTFFKVGGTSVH